MKTKTIFLAAAAAASLALSAPSFASGVCEGAIEHGYIGGSLFASDSIVPDTAENSLLARAYQNLSAMSAGDNFVWIVIDGSADSTGPSAHNKTLSKMRAEILAARLVRAGANPDLIKIVARGEENPRYDNSTAEGRRMNRSGIVTMYAMSKSETGRCHEEYPEAVDTWWNHPDL